MSKYEELTQHLKDLAKQIIDFNFIEEFANVVNFIEFIDHEIWLTKIKIYNNIQQ